jgi:iron(III) transport system substrate-binding protein
MLRSIALGLLAAMLAGDARAQAQPAVPPVVEIASYAGPDRTQRLIAGAKKEGALTLYSSGPIEDTSAITYAFEKTYGVPVRLRAAAPRTSCAAR